MNLCECGCGLTTAIVKETCRTRGLIKGQSRRYIRGHVRRGKVSNASGAGYFKPGHLGYTSALIHGLSETREYKSYTMARDRCINPKNPSWARYGGRGVIMCDRWLKSFESFLVDMGSRPANTSLGRILDRGGYEPGNCFWMTPKEQGLSVQNNHALERYTGM